MFVSAGLDQLFVSDTFILQFLSVKHLTLTTVSVLRGHVPHHVLCLLYLSLYISHGGTLGLSGSCPPGIRHGADEAGRSYEQQHRVHTHLTASTGRDICPSQPSEADRQQTSSYTSAQCCKQTQHTQSVLHRCVCVCAL